MPQPQPQPQPKPAPAPSTGGDCGTMLEMAEAAAEVCSDPVSGREPTGQAEWQPHDTRCAPL